LPLDRQSPLLKRPEQDDFINGLQQAGAEFAMNVKAAIHGDTR
jgi:hypothetical protein